MDTVTIGLYEIASLKLPRNRLEEMLAKNIMERNALIVALNETKLSVEFISTEVEEYNKNGYRLDVGYRVVEQPLYLYTPRDLPPGDAVQRSKVKK